MLKADAILQEVGAWQGHMNTFLSGVLNSTFLYDLAEASRLISAVKTVYYGRSPGNR